jgi:hypothetical protein
VLAASFSADIFPFFREFAKTEKVRKKTQKNPKFLLTIC